MPTISQPIWHALQRAYSHHGSRWFSVSDLTFNQQMLLFDRDYLEIVGLHCRITQSGIHYLRRNADVFTVAA